MGCALSGRLSFFLLGVIPITSFAGALPSLSASALAAWSLETNGVLKLRTSTGAKLKAFFQAPGGGKGSRVWIDFPGELSRPRILPGNGPVREIRLGKPKRGFTRLVVELNPSILLDPARLKLIGTSPDRWNLKLVGLPVRGFRRIGEGELTAYSSRRWTKVNKVDNNRITKSTTSLPYVPRGRYRVVIDPGHGGPDSGAIGIGGLRESNLVLDISLQVAQLLERKGVKVNLTRTSEVDLDLPPRVAIANRLGANAFVSIHANASRNTRRDVNGIETFYFSGSRGFRLASNIQKQVVRVSPGSPDRKVRKGRFFVIRRTNMPAALVETGFLTGRLDASRLGSSDHRRKLAIAIATGILKYLQGAS